MFYDILFERKITLKKYDIIIIGDGIIAKLTALKILEKSNSKIALIGNNLNNASKAAGAMIAVYGELEDKINDENDKMIFDLSVKSNSEWRKIIKKLNQNIITADNTIVYLKQNSNILEKKCFKIIQKYGSEFKGKLKISKSFNYTFLKNEFAIDTKILFQQFDKNIKKNKNIDYYLDEAVLDSSKIKVTLKNSKKVIVAEKIIIAAGSNSSNVLKSYNTIPIFHGVGTAIELESNELNSSLNKRLVYRTANRGGSHCGVHLIPRISSGSYYLGAGNYLTNKYSSKARMATVKYLIEALSSEISNEQIVHKARMNLVYGFRPISFDGRPVLGSLNKNKNIFICSGFNRIGLTISPLIVNEIIKWLKKDKIDSIFDKWHPNRQWISYNNKNYAIEAYSNYFVSNLLEHKMIKNYQIGVTKEKLLSEAKIKHKKLQKKYNLDANFGVDPEILSIF